VGWPNPNLAKQSRVFHTMCRHAGFRWGGRHGGNSLTAWERAAPVLFGRAAVWVVRFMSCFLLICIVIVPVPSVCCSVKLSLSQPTSFLPLSFHSPPHASGGRGDRVALLLQAAAETKTYGLCFRISDAADSTRQGRGGKLLPKTSSHEL